MSKDVIYQSKGALIQFIETNMGTVTATAFVGDGSLLQNVTGSGGGGGGGISWYGSTANGVATYKDADEAAVESNLTFDGSTLTVTGDTSITGDTTLGNASSDTVTFNAKNIVLTNVGAMGGTDDTVLVYNGSSIVTDEIDPKVWAGDLVDYTGTPANNQVAIWTDTDTLEGDSGLTFNGNTLTIAEPTSGDTLVLGRANGEASIKAVSSEHMIIDSDGQYLSLNHYEDDNVVLGYGGGNVGVGPNSSPAHLLTVATDVSAEAVVSVTQYNNSSVTDGPNILLQRARGTMASPAIVQDGDTIGSLRWYSYDGTDFASATAGIMAEVDGTPGSNDTPGRLLFRTTADGSNSLTERMRIASDGLVTIAGALTAAKATISTSNTGLTNDRALFVQNTADHCNIEVDAAAGSEANVIFSENTTVKWAIGNKASNDDLQFRINGWAQKAALSQTGDLQIDGDLTVTGNDIKGSGGTVITMDATNDVNLAGDLTVNGGDLFIKSTAVADLFFRRETASLVDGDDLGNIIFQATENGTNIAWSPAVIKAECSETFVEGSNEGTRLKFLTTPNGTAASTTNMTLDGNGNLDIAGALTVSEGVTSALGAPISTDLSAADEWVKVAEVDLEHSSYQVGAAVIDVILMGNEGSAEIYQARCHLWVSRYYYSNSQLQVDIIQDEGSVAWDTTDFILTQETSGTKQAQLYVRTPATNQSCYATITNGSSDGDENYKSDWYLTPGQTWAGSYTPLSHNPTTTNVKKRFDSLVIDGDLTMGAATSYIRDAEGHQRISIAGTGNIVLYDASGGTEFTVANGACTAAGNLTTAGSLFVQNFARIDGLRVGTTTSGPGDGNLYIEGITTAVGQIKPGWDPGIIAQTILDPSTATAFTITNSNTDLYRVIWSSGDTSTTDPKVSFTAPASGKVVVEVDCWEEDTSTGGSGPYVYLALSTSGDKTYIPLGYSTIVGTERAFWYAEQEQRGFKSARFYVTGLSSGATYIWYLYARRYNASGGSNILRCGGAYPLFEMRVRPIYSNASIYNT